MAGRAHSEVHELPPRAVALVRRPLGELTVAELTVAELTVAELAVTGRRGDTARHNTSVKARE